MLILGLSGNFSAEDVDLVPGMPEFYFHDAAASLVKDGTTLAAVEEERFNRIKKTTKFPAGAIRACLDKASVSPSDIDAVGYYFRQDFTDNALNQLYIENALTPTRYSRQLIRENLKREFGWDLPDDRLLYTPHHLTHAISCFVHSGMSEALVLVMDGRGEEECGTVFRAQGGQFESLATHSLEKSLGTLYHDGTQMLGYRLGDEYKIMGLAPYGNPETYREVFETVYSLGEKGEYEIYPSMLAVNLLGPAFLGKGFRPRRKGEEFSQQHMDLAAGLQQTLEKIVMHVLDHWARETGLTNLCFVGGVAHNSTLNGTILRSGLFEEVFIHPASHDAGAAEGAALGAAYQLGEGPYTRPRLRSASLGPALGDPAEIQRKLGDWDALVDFERREDIVETAAEILASGSVLGWAQGASEFGPRALGNRSILADARPKENQNRINAMVKKRESYRPFAPVVIPEATQTYFDIPETRANYDFMSFVVDVREERRKELGAVTHIDGSARVQVIDPTSDEKFYRLVKRFGEITGTPVLLNTSFNNNAEPIVQTVEEALACFLTTDLDFLIVEDFLVSRRPAAPLAFDDFVVRFRPVTRLARRNRVTPAGEREVVHEIYLDYSTGPRAELSPALYAILEGVDGSTTLRSLAGSAVTLDDELKQEIHDLWQTRFITLAPKPE